MMLTSLDFDANGHLTPHTDILVDWAVFANTFGWNEHRQDLLATYMQFFEQTEAIISLPHRHWIAGSFVSQKPYPKDIDVLVFVPNLVFSRVERELRQLKEVFAGQIDCYFVETFLPDHPKFDIGRADELSWYHFWRTDRRKRPRGIIELQANHGNSRRTGD